MPTSIAHGSSLGGKPNGDYCKSMEMFINSLCLKRDKCTFEEYISEMTEFFKRQDQTEMLMEVIGNSRKEITQATVKDILEETLNR